MPIIKSAKKRARQNLKRRVRNYEWRSMVKSAMKRVKVLVEEANLEKAVEALKLSYKTIDLAVKKNIFHANNGARKKSQLAKLVDKLKKSKK